MSFSAAYAKNCSIPRQDAIQYLTEYGHLVKWKNYKENILEVGCGEGSVTREILFPFLGNHVEKLEAIDKLEPMIELAKNINDRKEINFKTIDVNDEQYIARNENKFDHIFSLYCIQWIVDTRSLLRTFHKILKPEGQIFVTIISDSPIHRVIKKYITETKWSKYFPKKEYFANYTDYPEEYIRNILENTGFEVDLCKYGGKRNGIIENYKDFSKSLLHMSDLLDYLPPELREKYIEDCIKDICEECVYLGDPNKYMHFYESIVFVASKKT